jgi:DNA-binding response OmpR family regulator
MYALAVEPDPAAAEHLLRCLDRLGYEATAVATGEQALQRFGENDLVLLDLDLPDIDGLDVCRGIRRACDTAVIAFAGGGAEADRVLGLQAGADDCITKPYGLREVAARIEAITRRMRRKTPDLDILRHGELRIDPVRRCVWLGKRPIALTRKEFELLHLLASDPDRLGHSTCQIG